MRKRRLFGLLLLAPLGLLAGCGGPLTLSFAPNWFYNNTIESLGGTNERLEYEVTFTPSGIEGTSVSYDKGTYVTTLSAESVAQGEKTVLAYRYHTEFKISGKYTNGELESDIFEDSMVSTVWFTKAEDGLRPIKSEKTVHSTVPFTENGSNDWVSAYEFSYTFAYDEGLQNADYTLDIAAPASQKKQESGTIELDFGETFIDNEEIVMALRGLSLSASTAAIPFVTIDPQTRQTVKVGYSVEAQNVAIPAFTCNGELIEGNMDAVQVSCAYSTTNPGPTRRFLYAARTESSKKYRSVLLRFENPVMYSLGTMTYTLKSATFGD